MEELKIEELATEGSENTKLSEHSEASENTGRLESPDKSVTEQLEEMLAEAEKRGYLRARNEIAEVAMRCPRLWENPRRSEAEALNRHAAAEPAGDAADGPEFLSRISPGIWD